MNRFKISLLTCFLSLTCTFLNAQYVTISDSNFVNYLGTVLSPPALISDQLDTTHSQVINLQNIGCFNNNISSLEGIQYFDNLQSLNCSNNLLTELTYLPNTISTLLCANNDISLLVNFPSAAVIIDCSWNSIDSLPTLPTPLLSLYCDGNNLNTLPPLPSSLEILQCRSNQISALPNLPQSLTNLRCSANPLATIPSLPQFLIELNCTHSQLTILPSLPQALSTLDCGFNQLINLPVLPNSLTYLSCYTNQLNQLPILPASLTYLNCQSNQLTSLPSLPTTLIELLCHDNLINTLPSLPSSLNKLQCGDNLLTSIPNLPGSLTFLGCGFNQLTALTPLPPSLTTLYCDFNQLTSLPPLPSSLKYLYCDDNQLSIIPPLPDTLIEFWCNVNPTLSCLPELTTIGNLQFTGTGIQCLPNYGNITNSIPPLNTFPLCDPFNMNNCNFYYNISGQVYADDNNNCNIDSGEYSMIGAKINLYQGGNIIQQGFTGQGGLYTLDTQLGTYDYSLDTVGVPFLVSCPPSGIHSSILTALDSTDLGMDFGIECKPGFDVGVSSISQTSGQFFPADTATILVRAGDMSNFYNLNCASGTGGSIIINYTGPIQYAGNVPGSLLPTVTPNTLIYTIPDFGLSNFNEDFKFYVTTDTSAQAGQQVCFNINVTPVVNDNEPANNTITHCYQVVNSFDPNDKQVHPDGDLHIWDEWLNYTIRFQNTGTAAAQNIVITDTLDSNLQESTFSYLGSSHDPFIQVIGNIVKFSFPNINLPDSTSDEPNSHGYIQYKIKVDNNLPIGSIIENTAAIYFDFNPPVITNTTLNTIIAPIGITEHSDITLSIYPNPAKEMINVISSEILNLIKIYDVQGRCIHSENVQSRESLIDICKISSGAYHIVVGEFSDHVIRRMFIISR